MRKVRCLVYDYHGLTYKWSYDVIHYKDGSGEITLLNDYGGEKVYYILGNLSKIFTDVTREYRDDVIDGILS